jgi:hypothetical protein
LCQQGLVVGGSIEIKERLGGKNPIKIGFKVTENTANNLFRGDYRGYLKFDVEKGYLSYRLHFSRICGKDGSFQEWQTIRKLVSCNVHYSIVNEKSYIDKGGWQAYWNGVGKLGISSTGDEVPNNPKDIKSDPGALQSTIPNTPSSYSYQLPSDVSGLPDGLSCPTLFPSHQTVPPSFISDFRPFTTFGNDTGGAVAPNCHYYPPGGGMCGVGVNESFNNRLQSGSLPISPFNNQLPLLDSPIDNRGPHFPYSPPFSMGNSATTVGNPTNGSEITGGTIGGVVVGQDPYQWSSYTPALHGSIPGSVDYQDVFPQPMLQSVDPLHATEPYMNMNMDEFSPPTPTQSSTMQYTPESIDSLP